MNSPTDAVESETMSDPLKPSPGLLCKLASIIVHADEAASAEGHEFDIDAIRTVMNDPEVAAWIASMTAAGMAPVKRNV